MDHSTKIFGRVLSAYFVVAIASFSAVSCASLRSVSLPGFVPPPDKVEVTGEGWWHAGFIMNWPQDIEPAWYMDLVVAHKVISPILAAYRTDMSLWRFHRRAVRDRTGHQFSFIFYSSPQTARRVYDSIQYNKHLSEMRMAGMITKVIYDDTSMISRPNIGDTSDQKWSSAIRKSWPYYIMGVSQMWLNLIADFADGVPGGNDPDSSEGLQSCYQKVERSIREAWLAEGDHALLHHLNAIFGYDPVMIYEKRLMTF
jgi:hypothetical protein